MAFALSIRRCLNSVGRNYHVFNRNVYYQTDSIKYNIKCNDLEKWKIHVEKKIQELEMRVKALETKRESRHTGVVWKWKFDNYDSQKKAKEKENK